MGKNGSVTTEWFTVNIYADGKTIMFSTKIYLLSNDDSGMYGWIARQYLEVNNAKYVEVIRDSTGELVGDRGFKRDSIIG